ncbi:MAG: AI-2E family transporter [Bacteroidales bacterium]|nr:AI-2E family transporter [Bacteroidales bacterium]
MKISRRFVAGLVSVAMLVLLAWLFPEVVWYILISAVLSFIGAPIVSFFDKVKIFRRTIPHGLGSFLALLVIFVALMSVFLLFIPLIVTEAKVISSIDVNNLSVALGKLSDTLESWLRSVRLLEPSQELDELLMSQVEPFLGMGTFGNLFKNIFAFAGSVFMGIFSVLFITFFFLKDDKLFMRIILLFSTDDSERKVVGIVERVKHLLSRYFLGICMQISIMMTLLSLGLYLMGVPNALLIGVFGGMMNLIPYIGPLIGLVTGAILTALGYVALVDYVAVLPAMGKVAVVFLAANLVDNILLQPLIYSNSVKAHPLEIFLVIIMAGTLAGIPGMILAIPAYTVLRIVAAEFLGEFPVIGRLSRKI